MTEGRDRARFLAETLQELFPVIRLRNPENFHRDSAIQMGLITAIHHRHSALADFLHNLTSPQGLSNPFHGAPISLFRRSRKCDFLRRDERVLRGTAEPALPQP